MRFRRLKKRRSPSTNFVKMKFQSFMDISTVPDSMQIISISAGGENLLQRLPAQFAAFKYYKIGNITAKLVPASTLPIDPTGLSYEAGENTVDPRDQMSPGMMRITNGEDILEDLTGVSADVQRQVYNSMLLDPRWPKFMLQSGVKRFGKPRYWTIGQLHQDKWPGMITNLPSVSTDDATKDDFVGTDHVMETFAGSGTPYRANVSGSSPYGLFQTGHRGVLGWLPTDGLGQFVKHDASIGVSPFMSSPPEVEVFKLVLPPVHKTNYYYRLFITETVYFREPIMVAPLSESNYSYRPIDIFHTPGSPAPFMPQSPDTAGQVPDTVTGGNYGDS